eukprot:gene12748-17092_t
MLNQLLSPTGISHNTEICVSDSTAACSHFVLSLDLIILLTLPLVGSIQQNSDSNFERKYRIVFSFCISLVFLIIGSCVSKQVDTIFILASTLGTIILSSASFAYNDLVTEYRFVKTQLVELETMELARTQQLNEEHNSQLRHMIANLAHDLKTPLTALISTLDLISIAHVEIKSYVKNKKEALITISSIEDSMKYLDSSNIMMLMIINRCIDYVKAMKGLKLVPQLDTFLLKDIVFPSVECIKHFHDEISISLSTFTDKLLKPILSDSQWIQESLLCLLSNASKFSCRCNVTVDVKIVQWSDLLMLNSMHTIDGVFYEPPKRSFSDQEIDSTNRSATRKTEMTSDYSTNTSQTELSLRRALQLDRYSSQKIVNKLISQKSSGYHHSKEHFIMFEISDNSVGLSKETLKKLFKPSDSTSQGLTSGGTGIGLYTLACRVDALNGCYGAYNRMDCKGSTVWFALPHVSMDVVDVKCIEGVENVFENENINYSNFPSDRIMAKSNSILHKQRSSCDDKYHMIESVTCVSEGDPLVCESIGTKQVSNLQIQKSSSSSISIMDTIIQESSKLDSTTTENENNKLIPSTSLNILIVDDSRPISKSLSRSFELKGHHVDIAYDGSDGVRMFNTLTKNREYILHIIVMDIQMPIMNGFDAIKRIREIEMESLLMNSSELSHHNIIAKEKKNHKVWIIASSANSDADTRQTALECGADIFASKPFKVDELLLKYKSYLQE